MKKTKWVLTIFLTITLILGTFVGYAQPEEVAEPTTELTNQEILQGLQLPADTPVEQIQQENSDERRIIETSYGNFIRCKPEEVPADKRAELMARLQNSEVAGDTIDSNDSTSANQSGENALPSQNPSQELSTNTYVLNPSNDETSPHFSISTTSPYGVPLENPAEITITSNVGSIQSLEVYIDNVEVTSITTLTANYSWKASVSELTKGTHTLRVVGYTTTPDDPNMAEYITEESFVAFKVYVPFSEYGDMKMLSLSAPYDEGYVTIEQTGTYLYRFHEDYMSHPHGFVIIAYDMNSKEVGRSYYNGYIMNNGFQEIKMKLIPGRYRLVFKSNEQSLTVLLKEGVRLEDNPPTLDGVYDTEGYGVVGDQDIFWYLGSTNAYDIRIYIDDVLVSAFKDTESQFYSFIPNKIGTFALKFEARNTCDMSISGAASVIKNVSFNVRTTETITQTKSKLQTTYADIQAFYNNFIQEHSFGTQDGSYLLSLKEKLAETLNTAQGLLANDEATHEQLFNIEVDLNYYKYKLSQANLNLSQAYCSYDVSNHEFTCFGYTSVNTKVYLKMYDENFQLVDKITTETDNNGRFDLIEIVTILPNVFFAVLSAENVSQVKVYKYGEIEPDVNITFDAQNVITVIVSAKNVTNFTNCTFEVYFTPAELAPITFVKDALTPALTVGTYGDIEITEVSDGVVKFKVLNTTIPSGKYWTGVANMLQFESLQEGTGTVFAKIVTQ